VRGERGLWKVGGEGTHVCVCAWMAAIFSFINLSITAVRTVRAQCVALYFRVLQCYAVFGRVLQYVAVCCSVLLDILLLRVCAVHTC